jgi:hypothetical protein
MKYETKTEKTGTTETTGPFSQQHHRTTAPRQF